MKVNYFEFSDGTIEVEVIKKCNHIPFIDVVHQAQNGVPMTLEIKCVKCGQICVTKFRD